MKRAGPAAPPQAPADEPTRLGRGKTDAAALLKTYAAWTRPGQRAGVAAWYRLASQLDEQNHHDHHDPATPRSAPTRWPRTWVLSAALTAAFGLFLLARATPALPPTPGAAGLGGASGEAEAPGAGGTRGASGAQGSGGTAAVGAIPRRAG